MTAEPTEFTATSAPTMMPPSRARDAEPKPPCMSPAIAPRPAPIEPSAKWAAAPSTARMPRWRYGGVAPQRLSPPFPRSCNTAHGTMGMASESCLRRSPISRPDSTEVTPSAAASPNTAPPDNTTACARPTRFSGARVSVSRKPGAPPRTSTPAGQSAAQSTVVTPVRAASSVAWPTDRPGTSVMRFREPGRSTRADVVSWNARQSRQDPGARDRGRFHRASAWCP